jgi:hypothetical protein
MFSWLGDTMISEFGVGFCWQHNINKRTRLSPILIEPIWYNVILENLTSMVAAMSCWESMRSQPA